MTGGLKHTADCASRKLMYGQMRYYNCDCGAKMTGEEINRGMCHSFDKDGNMVEPLFKYKDLTLKEKVTYLEWIDHVLRDEFNEECREFARLIGPLRPHNDLRFRHNNKGEIVCPTFYDGCNCEPDHTQTDWNDLKEENRILKKVDAGHLSRIEGLKTRVSDLTKENWRLRELLQFEGYNLENMNLKGVE